MAEWLDPGFDPEAFRAEDVNGTLRATFGRRRGRIAGRAVWCEGDPGRSRKGIGTLIGDDYAQRLYGHPLVSTLAKDKRKPSYIGAETFASALVDLLAQDEDGNPVVAMGDDAAKLVDRVGADSALKPPLRALTNLGAETVDDLRRPVARWFDEGMNRVSGWYRRQTQLIIFAIGAVVAVGTPHHLSTLLEAGL